MKLGFLFEKKVEAYVEVQRMAFTAHIGTAKENAYWRSYMLALGEASLLNMLSGTLQLCNKPDDVSDTLQRLTWTVCASPISAKHQDLILMLRNFEPQAEWVKTQKTLMAVVQNFVQRTKFNVWIQKMKGENNNE